MIELYFEMAAAGFFILLYLSDLVKRQLEARRTMTFQILLGALMISSACVVMATLARVNDTSLRINAVAQAVCLYAEVICLSCFHAYMLSVAYQLKCDSPVVMTECILFVVISVMILSSPWTGICFYVDGQGVLHHKMPCILVCLILIEHLLMDFFMIWKNCRAQSRRRKFFYSVMILSFVCAVYTEMTHHIALERITVIILFLMYAFYLSLQSPDFYVDNATGAFNRNGFFEVLKERIAYTKKTSCLLIRVRNFNSMNQIYGEEILQIVQCRIRKILEENSDGGIYHIGASTFAVILKNENQVKNLYETVKAKIPTEWLVEDEIVKHEYSYYQVSYPQDCQNYEELAQRIHFARSDHESRHKAGSLVLLRHDTVEATEDKKRIAHLIEEAIMDNSVEIHFQPIYSIEMDKITSLEVLARLKDENKNYINPEYFIHIAEENHTIIQMGEQIFRKACIFASQNKIFEYGIEDININLSPAQCRYEGLAESLLKIASQYGIPMSRMHLEITESEFTDAAAVGRTLRCLRETGAKVALDDFGTGFSTLSNILELPVDFVKIDKSLVWSFAEGKNQFLNELMPMIKAEGKKIIAEGIETQEHIDIIKRLQGDYLQGYHYARPLPEKSFMRFLKEFNADKTVLS